MELGVEVVEEVGLEAPEVEGDHFVACEGEVGASGLPVDEVAVVVDDDFCVFGDGLEVAGGIDVADAS